MLPTWTTPMTWLGTFTETHLSHSGYLLFFAWFIPPTTDLNFVPCVSGEINLTTKLPFVRALIAALCLFSANISLAAEDGWHFGLGTGMLALGIEGDTGFTTGAGAIKTKVDLNADEVSDLLDSAIGFGGFAAHGKYTILFSYSAIELDGGVSGSLDGGAPFSASLNLEVTQASVAVSYLFAQTGKHAWGALFGLRYTDHKYDINFSIADMATRLKIDQDWTDIVVGMTHAYPLSDRFAWKSRVDYGFGGSEGTLFANTGISWRINHRFTTTLYAQITAIDFENR